MNDNRFFRISSHEAYESSRIALDSQRHVPQGETTYEPLSTAPKARNGDVLLAIRSVHCDLQDIASALAAMLENGWGCEIAADEYWNELPAPMP